MFYRSTLSSLLSLSKWSYFVLDFIPTGYPRSRLIVLSRKSSLMTPRHFCFSDPFSTVLSPTQETPRLLLLLLHYSKSFCPLHDPPVPRSYLDKFSTPRRRYFLSTPPRSNKRKLKLREDSGTTIGPFPTRDRESCC